MTKKLIIYCLCPICRGKIAISLSEEQFEEAYKALERKKALDLTKGMNKQIRDAVAG